jgi:hypothetical protein
MSYANCFLFSLCPRSIILAICLSLLATSWSDPSIRADEPSGKRVVAGKAAALSALVRREGSDKPWMLVKPGEAILSEDLIIAVPNGALNSKSGDVRLSLLSDLARLSPYPVLESAVILRDSADKDLDFTLDRGRVDVTNRKRAGAAHVRVRVRNQQLDLTLEEPRTRVALELYGRWPKGAPFSKDAKAEDEPTADLVLLVLNGSVQLKTGSSQHAMTAPPGPAYFHWDSAAGQDSQVHRLEEVPGWAKPGVANLPRAKDLTAVVGLIRKSIEDRKVGTIETVLVETLDADNLNTRRMGVYGLGALDDIGHLVDALNGSKHEDVREVAILALRHWIGRDKGQDAKLYNTLVKDKMFTANQAEIVMQLLHSFGDSDLAKPATYETLIDYLIHEKLAIRELAKFHLYRLVPAGKDIAYDPAGSAEDRTKAHDKWHTLIPNGKLPPKAGK